MLHFSQHCGETFAILLIATLKEYGEQTDQDGELGDGELGSEKGYKNT